ncbi:hypothetical protein [Undibacterium rugosum]|uniref:hypothetical protein n=1 Tax=Undibacterium rugosum TaxID=2762291 RepID=UPI001B80EE99|nr:hypothetical protein [Undibacterium rugosum]MBR7777656.1 hypothetical protein [Undibacterium rugosum]
MNSYRQKILVVILAALLPLTSIAASSSGRSGGSSSGMRGGFSSQKQAVNKAPARQTNSSFGSFSQNKDSAAAPAGNSRSAMQRDMDTTQARSNALKNMDAREAPSRQASNAPDYRYNNNQNNPASPGYGNAGGNNNAFGNSARQPGYGYGSPQNQPAQAQQQVYSQPPVVQRNNSGLMTGAVAGMVLGSVMSHGHANGNPQPAATRSNQQIFEPLPDAGTVSPAPQADNSISVSEATSVPAVQPSARTDTVTPQARADAGMGAGGVFVILLLLGICAWAGHRIWRKMNENKQEKSVHYSLGKG